MRDFWVGCANRIETDINVPLVVRGPGIGKNVTLDAITSHTDLAPTFLSIAGVTREGLDGKKIPTTIEASTAHNRSEHVAIEYWGLVSESTSFTGNT
jgi:arylsulfatase A-like enzyme